MNNFVETLNNELDSLQGTMAKCKTIYLRYAMSPEHRNFLMRQSVLTIYSEWEGFVKKTISHYLQQLNRERITCGKLHQSYLAYQTDSIAKFKLSKTDLNVITQISVELHRMHSQPVIFNTMINTESNANLKVVNSILKKLRLEELNSVYNSDLHKLLRYRNSVAHGDEGIPITQQDVENFTLLVQNIASELLLSVLDGFSRKVHLSDS
jgi:hypothetical protein